MDEKGSAICPEDRDAVFARVWQRVMEGREDGGLPARGSMQSEETLEQRREEENTAILPAEPMEKHTGRALSDFPSGPAVFLGEDSRESIPLLQEMIRHELRDWKEYQMLARRVGGAQARVFQGLANEEKRHAKALSAACFLISGVRYWPEGEGCTPPASYLGALRRRFGMEQEGMTGYLTAAEGTADPCLKQLFLDCAREEWDHACRIRSMVENA